MSDTTTYSTGNNKSLLVLVPDYADGVFEKCRSDDQAEETMTSFLRLGVFDYSSEPARARELLKLIHQCGPPGDPGRGDHLAGSSGDAFAWDADSDEFTSVPPLQDRTTAAPAASAGNRDVFFFDDVRIRDVDVDPNIADDSIKGHGLTMAQRQAESSRLYSRGGWRDHSDGNRISTTYGDKVEVVRGNYKMIVMGRQDDPGESMGWEVTGSHVVDYAPGTMPGAGYWLEWVADYLFTDSEGVARTGVWLLVNTTENVYEYARYGGNFREERWGDLIETYIGSANPPPTGSIATDSTHGTEGHEPPARLDGIKYDLPATSASDRTTPSWDDDNLDLVRGNPHIIEKTWARRIDSWTGSESCPVPEIHEKTFAGKIYGDTGSSSERVSEIHESTWANRTFELVDVSERIESNTRAGSIFEATTAGTIWESTTSALHIGIETGVVLDTFFGAKLEFDLAAVFECSVIKHVTLIEEKDQVTLSEIKTAISEKIASIDFDMAALTSTSMALSMNFGFLTGNFGI